MEKYSSIIDFVKRELSFDNSGHGFQHAMRVFGNAKKILAGEGGDEKIVLSAALIHDTVDKKLFENFEERAFYIKKFLKENGYTDDEISQIVYYIVVKLNPIETC